MRPDHKGQSQLDRKTLAKIHIARKDLRLSEEDYRDLLWNTTRHRSAAELTEEHLPALQAEFRRLGWTGFLTPSPQPSPARREGKRKYEELGDRPGFPAPSQLRKLDALFKGIRGYATRSPDQAFHGFLRNRFGISHPRFLDMEKYEKALKGVRELRARLGVKPGYEENRDR